MAGGEVRPEPEAGAGKTAGRTTADRVLGWIGGGMVVAALLLLVFGGGGGEGMAADLEGEPPQLELLSPADGDTAAIPLVLTFRSAAPLAQMAGGWGVEGLHLHAGIDGREAMPGPGDITRLDADRYAWTIPAARGDVRVHLFWSDAAHRPVVGGDTPPVGIHVR